MMGSFELVRSVESVESAKSFESLVLAQPKFGQSNIKAVVFDVFGTLIGQTGARLHPYQLLGLRQRGLAASPLMTRDVAGAVWLQELGREHLVPEFEQRLKSDLEALALFDDVAQALAQVRSAGLALAVCSNLAHAYGAKVRQALPDVDAHILSFEVGAAKPEPAIYDAVCNALSVLPGEVLFIGDSQRCDVLGPRAHGMQSFWLDRPGGITLLDALASITTPPA